MIYLFMICSIDFLWVCSEVGYGMGWQAGVASWGGKLLLATASVSSLLKATASPMPSGAWQPRRDSPDWTAQMTLLHSINLPGFASPL
ncbi:MAG: hypothetical protein BWY95_00991 [Bacteroidetes bacterium ADurb.BinA104]|nr:MAG: hypothetical protein BWY95_00991 [Bacteroidetes bacterium ADurb.BinA104]